MAKKQEFKTVTLDGDLFVCVIEHTMLASGRIGVSMMKSARRAVGDTHPTEEERQALIRILGVN
ncbi:MULTISPECIES: hypothetical protein [unclassified Microbacterium]|uniref:hypothetical protein n=1 Tax=unclassified Microbacterium TaxID=2609290 RepID=UPI003870B4C0